MQILKRYKAAKVLLNSTGLGDLEREKIVQGKKVKVLYTCHEQLLEISPLWDIFNSFLEDDETDFNTQSSINTGEVVGASPMEQEGDDGDSSQVSETIFVNRNSRSSVPIDLDDSSIPIDPDILSSSCRYPSDNSIFLLNKQTTLSVESSPSPESPKPLQFSDFSIEKNNSTPFSGLKKTASSILNSSLRSPASKRKYKVEDDMSSSNEDSTKENEPSCQKGHRAVVRKVVKRPPKFSDHQRRIEETQKTQEMVIALRLEQHKANRLKYEARLVWYSAIPPA